MFAIVKIGGSQYQVNEGSRLKVNKLGAEEGKKVNFDSVLLVADEKGVEIGHPFIKGAKVTAKVIRNFRGKKVTIMKYKSKTRYHLKKGFRPHLTEIEIEKITAKP